MNNDLPMYAQAARLPKKDWFDGRVTYEVVFKFAASHRRYNVEQIPAPNLTAVKKHYKREYPTLTWGRPKIKRAKTKARVTAKPRVSKRKIKQRRLAIIGRAIARQAIKYNLDVS